MPKKTFYVTTPIYYVNDKPHIGHSYTTVACDVLARFKRLDGFDVFFLTGTDEHGQKVETAAAARDLKPIELADEVVDRYFKLWEELNISNDDFIRTSQDRHKKGATSMWERVEATGDIYLGEYEDWYCTPCETFLTETQLLPGEKCPDCKRDVKKLKEESYFFKLSAYGDKLIKHIEDNPDFIQPKSKRNEVLSFLKEGLRDLSISRTTFSWGVPVPGNDKHIMYVWFDALSNYLSADGFPDGQKYWPADVHVIGKDILRFHAVFWPAFLMSADLPLPKKVFAHGWWTIEGEKMSKSLGNVIDPFEVIENFGADRFRYFLLREVPFGGDGDYSQEAFVTRATSELANDYGNLVSRTVAMAVKQKDNLTIKHIESMDRDDFEGDLKIALNSLYNKVGESIENLAFNTALDDIWKVIRDLNGYVNRCEPWAEKDGDRLANVLYTLLDGIRIINLFVYPFIPMTSGEAMKRVGVEMDFDSIDNLKDLAVTGLLPENPQVIKGEPLFPKIEL